MRRFAQLRGRASIRGDIQLETTAMLDLVALAIGLGFFALSILYGLACDTL
jgi:hypothetical protein